MVHCGGSVRLAACPDCRPGSPPCNNPYVRLVIIVMVIAVLLHACGGSDPAEFADVAPAAAEEAVLAADDLPPGWREAADSTLDRVELSAKCDVLSPRGAFPKAAATAFSPLFSTVDRRSAQSFSAVFESPGEASAALAELDARVEGCRDEFQDAVREVAAAEIEADGLDLGPLARIDVSIDKGAPPDAGSEAVLYQVHVGVSVLGVGREFSADVALVREERVVGALAYSTYGQISEDDETAFVQVMARHLADAEEMLP